MLDVHTIRLPWPNPLRLDDPEYRSEWLGGRTPPKVYSVLKNFFELANIFSGFWRTTINLTLCCKNLRCGSLGKLGLEFYSPKILKTCRRTVLKAWNSWCLVFWANRIDSVCFAIRNGTGSCVLQRDSFNVRCPSESLLTATSSSMSRI